MGKQADAIMVPRGEYRILREMHKTVKRQQFLFRLEEAKKNLKFRKVKRVSIDELMVLIRSMIFLKSRASMKPVVQGEKTGCGIACVATLARVTYNDAKLVANKIGISANDSMLWSDANYVRELCAQFNIKLSKNAKPFLGWDKLPNCALLAIKWHIEDGMPFWHWTVFSRNKEGACVLDPKKKLKKNRRTDFSRIKPKWFIKVDF